MRELSLACAPFITLLESTIMIGIGIAELVLLGVCSLVMLAGFMGAIIWIVAARRRGHGPLVPCPQCGRNSPPGSHCPNCDAVRQ